MNELDKKKQLEKRIKKQMNQTITQKVIKVLLIICLILISTYFGVDALLTSFNYNPFNEERFLERSEWNEEEAYDFNALFQTFIKTFYPGYKGYVNTVKDTDFGTYKAEVSIVDYLDYRYFPPVINATLNIKHSNIESLEYLDQTERSLILQIYEFNDPSTQRDDENAYMTNNIQSSREDVLEFPDSSLVEASLSFNDYFSVDDLAKMIKTYDATFYWAAVETIEHEGVFGTADGFSLSDNHGYEVVEELKERYPNLILMTDDEKIPENIRNHYISQLQLLLDHPEFTKMMTTYFGNGEFSGDYIEKRLEAAKNEIKLYGVRIVAKKQELLKMMGELDLSYVQIKDVRLSEYSK